MIFKLKVVLLVIGVLILNGVMLVVFFEFKVLDVCINVMFFFYIGGFSCFILVMIVVYFFVICCCKFDV